MGKGALAFIAGLGTGYLNQKNREEEKARQDKFDQIALDRADRERSDYEKKQRVANRLADASKSGEIKYENVAHQGVPMLSAQDPLPGEEPVQVMSQQPIASQGLGLSKDDTPKNISPPMAPIASQGIGGYTRKVTFNGKEYADESAAKADIEKYNLPEARNARNAQVLREEGDYASAMDLEAKAIHTEASQLNLNQAKEQEARLTFGRGMVNAYSSGGGAGLISFLSNSHADGEGGAEKFDQQLSPDGKVATVFKISPKGERIKVGDVPNTEEGWNSIMFRMQKGLDPNALFAHSAAIKKQEWEERKVSATERKAEADALRAEANDRKTNALIAGIIGTRGRAGSESQSAGLTAADLEKASSAINTRITEIYQPKEGASQEERAALGVKRNKRATEAQGIWAVNNKSGNAIDVGTAIYAADLAVDTANLTVKKASDGNFYPGVMINGAFVVTGTPVKEKPTPPPPPPAPPPSDSMPAKIMAAAGIRGLNSGAIPAEPKKGKWVGNEWVLNPEHALWMQKYAPKVQEEDAAANQRVVRALDNPFIK